MSDPYLLHIFSPTKYVSPFDINMAYEANFDAVIPYCDAQIDEDALGSAERLLVAADANAVPPSGIAGGESYALQTSLPRSNGRALGIGALAIGDIKYRVHTGLLGRMHETDSPVYLSYPEAFEMARGIVAERL